MARIANPGKLERREWSDWVASRPLPERELAARIDPWTLYRMRSTGWRVLFYGLRWVSLQDIHITVEIAPKYNLMLAGTDRLVTTVVEDLEPCPLPCPGERVGLFDVGADPAGRVTVH